MTTLKETFEAIENFFENTKDSTNLYQNQELGKILYSSLLQRKRDDGLVGFGPRDIWNTDNEELVNLVKQLEADILSQTKDTP
jgi:hypothetical protein